MNADFRKSGLVFLLFFFILASGNAQPQEEPSTTPQQPEATPQQTISKGYDWLLNESQQTTPTIEEQALSLLALVGQGTRQQETSALLDRLLTARDEQEACWPAGSCTVKDTALVYLTLTKTGSTTTEATKTWLKDSLQAGLRTGGEWRIQIETAQEGTCTLTWGEAKRKDFTLKDGKITNSAKKHYIALPTDIQDSSILATPNTKINVDCSSLSSAISGSDIIISLVYAKTPTELYLLESTTGSLAELTLANACFSDTQQNPRCNYEHTLYATWALIESGEKLFTWGTHTYLESNLGGDDHHKALLVRILLTDTTLSSTSFVTSLAASQRPGDGSWKSGDITTTALAILALAPSSDHQQNVENGRLYLQRKQNKEGSWNGNIKQTSLSLIGLKGDFSTAFVQAPRGGSGIGGNTGEICDDTLDNDEDTITDCGDPECISEEHCRCDNKRKDTGEEGIDCGGTCPQACDAEEQPLAPTDECVVSSECSDGERCVDGSCVRTTAQERCAEDSDCDDGEACQAGSCIPEEESNLGIIILLLAILLLAAGGVFFYLKYVKTGRVSLFKKKTQPTFEEFTTARSYQEPAPKKQPFTFPRTNPLKSSTEDEALERSLKEAEKLLKQK